jgi:hypothetical protein
LDALPAPAVTGNRYLLGIYLWPPEDNVVLLVGDNVKEDTVQLVAVDVGICISYLSDSALNCYVNLGEVIGRN